jgi:hypothetical protein
MKVDSKRESSNLKGNSNIQTEIFTKVKFLIAQGRDEEYSPFLKLGIFMIAHGRITRKQD